MILYKVVKNKIIRVVTLENPREYVIIKQVKKPENMWETKNKFYLIFKLVCVQFKRTDVLFSYDESNIDSHKAKKTWTFLQLLLFWHLFWDCFTLSWPQER